MPYTLTESIHHGNYTETRTETYADLPSLETFASYHANSPYAEEHTKESLLANAFFRETYDTLLVNFYNDITDAYNKTSFGWSTFTLEETE